jgi:hypothetical protein
LPVANVKTVLDFTVGKINLRYVIKIKASVVYSASRPQSKMVIIMLAPQKHRIQAGSAGLQKNI